MLLLIVIVSIQFSGQAVFSFNKRDTTNKTHSRGLLRMMGVGRNPIIGDPNNKP